MTLPKRLTLHARRWGSGWRRTLLTTGFVLLTLLVIGRLLFDNRETLIAYRAQLRPAFLLLAVFFFIVDLLLALCAWHLLVSRLTPIDSFRLNSKINLYSNLARRVPGSVWYVASRALLYEQHGVGKKKTALLSALEMAMFLCSGIVTTLLTLPFWNISLLNLSGSRAAWAALAIGVLALGVVHPRVLGRLWQRLAKQPVAAALTWRHTLGWLVIYTLTWVVGGLVLYSVINVVQPLPVAQLPFAVGVWSLAGTISLVGFLSISLFGLREVSLALLLTPIMPLPVAILIGIGIRLIWLTGELVSALISLRL